MSQPTIDPNKYQVWLYTSRVRLPFSFAVHPWFVVNNLGTVARYEVTAPVYDRDKSVGHLNQDVYPPFRGWPILRHFDTPTWPIHLCGFVEGDEQSLAKDMIDCIESTFDDYPYRDIYNLTKGPNSNTYAQWVLEQFPQAGMHLPWNAFGKKYRA